MKRKNVVWFVVVLLLAAVLLQSSILIYKGLSHSDLTAKATQGGFSLCINHPPDFYDITCNSSVRQSRYYSCQLNVSDFDNNNLNFTSQNYSGPFNFNISDGGLITAFPDYSMVGTSLVVFTVRDDSGCVNNVVSKQKWFEVIDVNDPPVFVPPMGPFEWSLGDGYRGVFLDAYFYDPDNDPLTYSHSAVPSGFLLTVTDSDELIFSASSCGEGYVIFTATDPENLSASSTPVYLTVPCPSAGGSSGGGGSDTTCTSDWYCDDWQKCLENSTQKKRCEDHAGCEDEPIYVWRNCTYIPQCENGLLDFNERGVDCGGPCPACPSCDDGIKNQGELGVDCGGPCPVCMNCFDGVQNFGELGVDCGGSCPACPTCYDGIKNQNETGVDCGGSCPACKSIETPSPVTTDKNNMMFYVIGGVAALAFLAVVYRLFHKQLQRLFAKLFLFLVRKHKKEILLSPEQRDSLLDDLNHLEKQAWLVKPTKKTKALFQDELAVILRKLFIFLIGHSVDVHEVDTLIDKLKASNLVKHILKKQYTQLLVLEQDAGLHVSGVKLQAEMLRERIFDLSNVTREIISREVEEMNEVDHGIDAMNAVLYNLYLALQFQKTSAAKKKYLRALEIYETLTLHEQAAVFGALHLAFDNIRYVATYSRK